MDDAPYPFLPATPVAGQASQPLSSAIVGQANVLAYADGFGAAAAIGAFGCLVLTALRRRGALSAF